MENVFQIPDCMFNRHIKQKTINRKGHQMGSRMRHTKNDNQHTRSYVLITKTTLNIKCETEICSFFSLQNSTITKDYLHFSPDFILKQQMIFMMTIAMRENRML